MGNEIINQNADEQEVAQASAATTNLPAEEKMSTQNTNTSEAVSFPDFPEIESTVAATEPQQTEIEIQKEALSTPHDDFDWSVDKRNVTSYDKLEREKYDEVYDKTFKQINDNEMIHGTVVGMTKTDVVINIGFKSDGLVSLNEFRDMPNLNVGDDVEVMVAEKEEREGNLH